MIEAVERDRHKRDQILAVSSKLFGQRGFANVSIRDICNQAGVTAPTIYHYFSSKDRLFQEVIQETLNLRDFCDSLAAAVGKHPEPTGQLHEFIATCLSDFPRDFFNPGMFLQATTQVNQASMEQVSAELKAVDDIALAILRDGITRGRFRDVDPDQTHRYLMNTLISYLLLDVHYQQNDQLEATAQFIYEMLMGGLRQEDRTSQDEELGGIE